MSIIGLSMAVLPCRAEEDVEAGSAALRVNWPVYPRGAEHNTVAEGGNRRWAEIVPAGLPPRSDARSGLSVFEMRNKTGSDVFIAASTSGVKFDA
jgi:hypothetical protein